MRSIQARAFQVAKKMGTRKSGQPCSKELLSVLNCISDTQGKTEGCEKAILAMQMCLEGAKTGAVAFNPAVNTDTMKAQILERMASKRTKN